MAADPPHALRVRVGEDLGTLADDLAAHLEAEHRDVLARDVLVVPTPGIGRWVARRLSQRLGAAIFGDGVFANTELLLWSGLLARVLEPLGIDASEWSLERMAMQALGALAAPLDDGVARLVPRDPGSRSYPVARRCADLFDQLFRWRPD